MQINENMDQFFTTKLIFLFVLLISVLGISIIPIIFIYGYLRVTNKAIRSYSHVHDQGTGNPEVYERLLRRQKSLVKVIKRWTDRINSYAAGVLIAAGMFHIYPDAVEMFREGLKTFRKDIQGYPFTSLFTLIGLVVFLLLDATIELCIFSKQSQPSSGKTPTLQSRQANNPPEIMTTSPPSEDPMLTMPLYQVLVLTFCISFHSVLEGITLGLLSNLNKLMTIFIAVLFHTLIIAFSIGMKMAEVILTSSSSSSGRGKDGNLLMSKRGLLINGITLVFFAAALPLGMAIGMSLVNKSTSPVFTLALAVIQSLCCGTFFFIVFAEILPECLFSSGVAIKEKLIRIILFTAGIATLILSSLIGSH